MAAENPPKDLGQLTSLEDFLNDEGILEEVTQRAIERVIALANDRKGREMVRCVS